VNLLGVLMAIVIASSPPPTSADWSITAVGGSAIAATGTSVNPQLLPGQASTGEYLITHTDAIAGPLDVTASTTDAPSSFEDNLLVTVAVNGVAGQTMSLDTLLWNGGVVRATSALPSGPVVLTVTIELAPNASSAQRLRSIDFTLFATVSDEVVSLPTQPDDPFAGPPPLASTGQAISLAAILLGGSLSGLGLILVLRRRRRRPATDIAHEAD
jgi:LPXTG-motif cell wall-anchored protein